MVNQNKWLPFVTTTPAPPHLMHSINLDSIPICILSDQHYLRNASEGGYFFYNLSSSLILHHPTELSLKYSSRDLNGSAMSAYIPVVLCPFV